MTHEHRAGRSETEPADGRRARAPLARSGLARGRRRAARCSSASATRWCSPSRCPIDHAGHASASIFAGQVEAPGVSVQPVLRRRDDRRRRHVDQLPDAGDRHRDRARRRHPEAAARARRCRAAAYFVGKIVLVAGGAPSPRSCCCSRSASLFFDLELPTDVRPRGSTFAWVFVLGSRGLLAARHRGSAACRGRRRSAIAVSARRSWCCSSSPGCSSPFTGCRVDAAVAAFFPLKWMAQGMRSVFLPDRPLRLGAGRVAGSTADRAGARGLDRRQVGAVPATFRWQRQGDG